MAVGMKGEDYEERMNQVTKRNFMKVILLALHGINFGYYLVIFNPLGEPLLEGVYSLPKDQVKGTIGNINMAFSLGAFLATLVSGIIAERIGRRRLVILYDIFCVVMISLYWIKDLNVLLAVRFFNGFIAAGSQIISAIILTELLPRKVSGVANTSLYSTVVLFGCAAYVQPKIFDRTGMITHWRYILMWPIIPLALKALLLPCFFPKESPKFYMKSHIENSPEETRERMKSIFRDTYRESQVTEITEITMSVVEKENQSGVGALATIIGLLKAEENRRRITTGFILSIGQQATGYSYLNLYSTDLFERLMKNGKEVTFAMAIGKVLAGVIAIFTMKTFSRKVNLMFGTLLQALTFYLILVAAYYQIPTLGIVAAVAHLIFFGIALGGVLKAYLTEILPPIGVSITLSSAWLSQAAVGKLIPLLAARFGDEILITAFCISGIVLFFLFDWRLLETKDKNEAQVIDEFTYKPYRYMDFS